MKLHNDSPPDPQRLDLEQQVEALQRGIRKLQLEHDLLKRANELLKKGLGVDLPLLSNQEKTLLVDALKHTYTLSELFAELDLARSSYFYHCARLKSPDKYADARVAITDVFQSNHRCYGYRRMRAALGRRQLHISEKVVQRLMKQERLVVAAIPWLTQSHRIPGESRTYGINQSKIYAAPPDVNFRSATTPLLNGGNLTGLQSSPLPADAHGRASANMRRLLGFLECSLSFR